MSAGANPSPVGPSVAIGELLAESAWIRSLARSLVRDPQAADDIVQETWIAVLRRPPRAGQPLRPWLGQVVRNFARMRRRGESNRRRREERAARREAVPATTDMVERVEVHRTLADSVLELDEPFRSTVLLRYFEGLSAAEIARRTGTPAGTVRWRLKRGLELLRGRLDAEKGGREGWLGAVAALAEQPEASIGLGPLALPFPLVAALGVGILAVAATLLVPGLLEWRGRGPSTLAEPAAPVASPTAPLAATESLVAESAGRRTPGASEPEPAGATAPANRTAVLARLLGADGAPLEGIELRAGAATSLSGAAGEVRLELDASAARSLELVASGKGLVPRHERARVDPGGVTHLGDLVLHPGGVVQGRVVGPSGRALAGATITVEPLGGRWLGFRHLPLEEARYLGSLLDRTSGRVPEGRTDEEGRFAVGGLPAGFVRVWAGAPEHFHGYSEPVAILPGDENQVGTLVLRRPGPGERIEGTVVDPDGAPVVGARVEAARRSLDALFFRDEPFVFQAETGADGRFVLALDPASRYDLAAADREGIWRPVVDGPRAPGERDVLLRLAGWETLELEISGPETGAVELTLVDARRGRRLLPEMAAAALPELRAPWTPFLVRLAAPGFAPAELGPYDPGRVPDVAAVSLSRLTGPVGRVVEDGAPVAGAVVTLRRALPAETARVFTGRTRGGPPLFALCERGAPVHRTPTDDVGRFVLPASTPGHYLLRIEIDGRARAALGPLPLFDAQPASLDIELAAGGVLEGRVLAPDGASTAGTIVGITCGDGHLRSQRAGAEGRYRFEDLPAGRWQVRPLRRETPALEWGRLASTAEEVHTSEVVWDCEVLAGATTRFDLRLAPPVSCRLEGRLTIDGGAPGAWHGHLVPLNADADPQSSAALDHEGRFVLSAEEPGLYALELWNSGYRPVFVLLSDEVFLDAGGASWSLELTSARVRGTGGAPEQEDLEHVWYGGGALVVTTRLECDGEGGFGPQRVPAGVGEVKSGGRTVITVDLAEGEERELVVDGL